ncbi:hypothetical protein A2548_06145 [candidate division WOR-1 bacterium RIFOXYD2_FULL_41_8]|nr:MAG: hypothetical protein A2548_06145 [candidate division WOR-1 bacterium RIFOXYD2_FULL_41_8]
MIRPIYFYTKLKEESWRADALTFLLITAWLVTFFATVMVFITQLIALGSPLISDIKGFGLLVVLPVLLTLMLVFFMLILLILGGVFVSGFFVALYLVALVLHYIYSVLGKKGSLNRMIQSTFYSSAVLLPLIIVFLLMIITKRGALSFELFRVGYNFFYFLMVLYVYGLWAIAVRKNYQVSRPLAFVGTLVPVLGLLIFGLIFDKIAFSKIGKFIT